jgi:hypothetical protein
LWRFAAQAALHGGELLLMPSGITCGSRHNRQHHTQACHMCTCTAACKVQCSKLHQGSVPLTTPDPRPNCCHCCCCCCRLCWTTSRCSGNSCAPATAANTRCLELVSSSSCVLTCSAYGSYFTSATAGSCRQIAMMLQQQSN